MAALTANNPRLWKGTMETAKVLIKNGESWKAGQFLHVDTSGLLAACGDNHKAGAGGGGSLYYALTDQADPGNSTTLAKVGVVTNDQVWLVNELDTTATSASIGQEVAFEVDSNICTFDISDGATNPFGRIVGVLSSEIEPIMNDAADTKARFLIQVYASVYESAPQA